jgi:dephospho-CoA kinase
MKVIGLTGGIGSGKSVVADILKVKYGACILDTDGIAKSQMEPGGASYKLVVDYFGKEILSSDGSINRQKLAKIIFEDKGKRLKINELTHPIVLEAVKREIENKRKEGKAEYLIVETALMIEARYDFICDEVWYVYAPEEVRRCWLKASRSYTDEKIDSIMANQSKEEAFRAMYSKVIENIGDIQYLEKQIDSLLRVGVI